VGIGIRYLDLVLLAIALPVFLLAGLPMAGYVVLAAAWLAQRGVQLAAERQAARSLKDGVRRSAVGVLAGSMLVRLWLVTLPILLVGVLGDREDGLAAAVLAAILVTVSLISEALSRAFPVGEAP
jgi:Trk-type K+ transport system membrane component